MTTAAEFQSLQVFSEVLQIQITSGTFRLTHTFLACLFRRKSQAIVIARLSSCKNLNVAHYSKNTLGINTKLGILAHHDKVQLQDMGRNSESCSFGATFLT